MQIPNDLRIACSWKKKLNWNGTDIFMQIQNVYLMRKEMVEKAAEIMGRKGDNSYFGRNLINHKEGFLKEMKETNPTEKTQNAETVRLLMKENAKKCNRK